MVFPFSSSYQNRIPQGQPAVEQTLGIWGCHVSSLAALCPSSVLTSTDQHWPLAQCISRWGGVYPRKAPQGPAPFQLALPTEPLLGPDEGSMPGGQAAISFCQLSPGLHHSGGAFLLQPAPPSPPCGWWPGLRARPLVEFAAQLGNKGTWGPAPRAVRFPHRLHQRPLLTPACGSRLLPSHRPARCTPCPRRRSPTPCRTRTSAPGCSPGEPRLG